MNVLWFNFIFGLIFVYGSLALSHPRFALASSLPFIRAKSENLIQMKITEVKVTKVKCVFSKGVSPWLFVKNFVLFCFHQKKAKQSVL